MKIAPLLAQYLYIHKRLDIPGIGSFLLDPSLHIEPETNKQGKAVNPEGITFENNPTIKESPDLVQFIATQTGTIKALAAADLDSHIGLAQQFMNIGKPFLFEGIGSLVKTQARDYAFTSGLIMPESMKDYSAREISSTSSTEESFSDYRNLNDRKLKAQWRKPLVVFLLLAGFALAIWGGYTVYKRSTSKKKAVVSSKESIVSSKENTDSTKVNKEMPIENKEKPVVVTDSVHQAPKDSVITPPKIYPAGMRKFVLEVSNSKRAFERFGRLRTFQWNVQMETKDSLIYTIYMLLPVANADTSRILDSLSRLNGRRVHIL